MKKLFCLMIFSIYGFLLSVGSGAAQTATDARDLALGGLAIADGPAASAVFINPALLTLADSLQTAYTQTRLSVDQFDFQVSGGFPLLPGIALGFGWNALAVQNQEEFGIVRDSNGQVEVDPSTGQPLTQVLGFFTQSDNRFYASAAAQFGFLSLGASLKYDLVDFASTEGSGWGLDLAVNLALGTNARLGFVLSDPGNRMIHFNDGSPPEMILGQWAAACAWKLGRVGPVSFTVEPGIQKDLWDDTATRWGGGVEASWLDNVFLRVGANNQTASLGVGLVAHPEKIFKEVSVDYTYLTQASDGYPSRLTLSVKW
jgi:hypothetical protein